MGRARRVGCYMSAIRWIADNDDTSWLEDDCPSPSISLCLVSDIFGRSVENATTDLRKILKRRLDAQRSLEQARDYVRSVLAQVG